MNKIKIQIKQTDKQCRYYMLKNVHDNIDVEL